MILFEVEKKKHGFVPRFLSSWDKASIQKLNDLRNEVTRWVIGTGHPEEDGLPVFNERRKAVVWAANFYALFFGEGIELPRVKRKRRRRSTQETLL